MKNDKLDQFYTKEEIAKQCINDTFTLLNKDDYDVYLEPSSGTGSFYFNLDENKRIGLDIDPKGNEILKMDLFEYIPPKDKKILTIGNPPFGTRSTLAIKFFKYLSQFSNTIAFIVPLTWSKFSIQRQLPNDFKLLFSKKLERFAFIYNNNECGIGCVFQIWTNRKDINFTDNRIYIKPSVTHEDFDFLRKEDYNNSDFYFVNIGYRKQLVKDKNTKISLGTVECIKCNKTYVREIFENVDWSIYENSSTSTMALGREVIVKEYVKMKEKMGYL